MKSILGTLIFLGFFCGISWNALASEEIYNALDVEEKPLSAPRIELKYQKMVGGIICVKRNHMLEGISFACTVSMDLFNSEEVYNALNVRETSVPAATFTDYVKSVDNLTCTRSVYYMPNRSEEFSCHLDI